MPAAEGILLIDLPNSNIVPGHNFQSHGPAMMRPSHHDGFTLLPTDPPPPTPPRTTPPKQPITTSGPRIYGAPVNGQPPQYHSVPDAQRKQAPQYQEIPYETSVNGHAEPAPPARQISMSQQSDTEADQALFGLPNSNSTAPLTELPPPPPGERRPRKKANPLYDDFKEVVTTTSSSTKKMSAAPTKRSCGRRSFGCIKHPVTICLIILVVLVNFVALLLLVTGTVEQVMPGSKEELVMPATAVPDQAEMLAIIRAQGDMITRLEARIIGLELLLMTDTSENASTTARIAQNTIQIAQLTNQVSSLAVNTTGAITGLQDSLSDITTKTDAYIRITSNLQTLAEELKTNTTIIGHDVTTLTARSQTNAQDIVGIETKNNEQDQQIGMLMTTISVVRQEFDFELSTYNHSIYEDLAEISKMQGPAGHNGSRGADGVSNLNGCRYKSVSETSSFNRVTTVPPINIPQGYTLTGATCSTYDGTSAYLMDDSGIYCKCDGEVAGTQGSTRFCYIHYWECPTE